MPDTDTAKPRIEGFIVMTRNLNWAWGQRVQDALRNVREMPGERARKGERVVYQLPTGAVDAWVDQMGAVRWTWADDAPDRNAVGITIEEPPA